MPGKKDQSNFMHNKTKKRIKHLLIAEKLGIILPNEAVELQLFMALYSTARKIRKAYQKATPPKRFPGGDTETEVARLIELAKARQRELK